jgi:vancomycin permeability regulator SanA
MPDQRHAPGWNTRFVRAGSAVVVVCALYLGAIALVALRARPLRADLAVVLGNQVTANGGPSPRLRARLDTALGLYAAGLVRRALVSGGIEQPGNRDEAAIMAAYLIAHSVPAVAIVQESHGLDTLATSRRAACILGEGGSAVVVTQWFRVPRTLIAMRRSGIRDVSAVWPRYLEWRDLYSLLREAIAIPIYSLKPASAWSAPCPPPSEPPRPRS